jgi:hypothetical protein
LIFIALNAADAWLTQQLLSHDGTEAFWWSSQYNSNIIAKGLLAPAVALLFTRLGKAHLLKWLNIGMAFVVLSKQSVTWSIWAHGFTGRHG